MVLVNIPDNMGKMVEKAAGIYEIDPSTWVLREVHKGLVRMDLNPFNPKPASEKFRDFTSEELDEYK